VKINRLSLSIVSCLLLAAPLAHAQNIVPKQLAGPPSEFANMAPANLADAAIYSKSALLPITMNADKAGGFSAHVDFPVEGENARFLVFAGGALDWNVSMRSPKGGAEKAATALATDYHQADFGMGSINHPAGYYEFDGLQKGNWNLKLSAASKAQAHGFVLIEGESSTQLVSYQTHGRQLVGEKMGFVASLYADGEKGASFGKAAGSVGSAALRVTEPNGDIQEFAMFDDGMHADGSANDGIFGGDFVMDKAGQYLAQVTVRGSNSRGVAIVRSAEHPFPVLASGLQVSATKANAIGVSDGRLDLRVPVSGEKAQQHYRAYAEVWGSDAQGNAVPVAWVSGMTTPDKGSIGFGLDTRWVSLAAAKAPFELRNLRIEDPDYFVTVASADKLALNVGTLKAIKPSSIVVDEAMTMGERPASINADKGVGKRLLLVHGYCSGGVWPAAQFGTSSVFADNNQNRTHDEFARLIQSFGATWNSFGVVAHSQGGAASLHLYHYYWSGLDNATGSRLIQSVGTPYQGTNLSGILAAMGNWFGVGCGTNNNMTYSGASSWLAGIPNSSRAKVNYHTTSFRLTNWYTNDFCQFATDLVLTDPEDGTTEQAKGQVPGAVNRGHVTGQCHTAGMRDLQQTLDSGRNSTMNSTAAR